MTLEERKELRAWAKSLNTIGMEALPEQEETEQETETKSEITDTVQNIIKLLKTMDKTTIVKLVY